MFTPFMTHIYFNFKAFIKILQGTHHPLIPAFSSLTAKRTPVLSGRQIKPESDRVRYGNNSVGVCQTSKQHLSAIGMFWKMRQNGCTREELCFPCLKFTTLFYILSWLLCPQPGRCTSTWHQPLETHALETVETKM